MESLSAGSGMWRKTERAKEGNVGDNLSHGIKLANLFSDGTKYDTALNMPFGERV